MPAAAQRFPQWKLSTLTLSEFDMSFVHLVPDHHGDGLLGTMLLDYKSVKLYREILLTTGSISGQILAGA